MSSSPKSNWPRQAEIGGVRWRIQQVADQLGDGLGDTDPKTRTIRITTGETARETLLHELIHTIGDDLGIEPSERTVCTLTHALSGFLRSKRNRALILKILED